MVIDTKIDTEHGVAPIAAHYYQRRHNVSRLLSATGRTQASARFLSATLDMLVRAIPAVDKRTAVLLELMGAQIFSYYIGMAEKGLMSRKQELLVTEI